MSTFGTSDAACKKRFSNIRESMEDNTEVLQRRNSPIRFELI